MTSIDSWSGLLQRVKMQLGRSGKKRQDLTVRVVNVLLRNADVIACTVQSDRRQLPVSRVLL